MQFINNVNIRIIIINHATICEKEIQFGKESSGNFLANPSSSRGEADSSFNLNKLSIFSNPSLHFH